MSADADHRLPRNAQELIDTAMMCGWSYSVEWGRDSQEAPFLTVNVGTGWDHHYRVTWHTRDTGTLRLFGKPLDYKRRRDMPSLAAVLDVVRDNPQQWVLDVTGRRYAGSVLPHGGDTG